MASGMVNKILTRVATTDDHFLVSELLGISYPALMSASYDSKVLAAALPFMTKANPSLLKSGAYYLALAADGQAIGCGGWSFERPGGNEITRPLAHIRHFGTHPAWTRRGIGRELFSQCKASALLAGAEQFECLASLNAESFYKSLGFITIRHAQVAMGPYVKFPAAVMSLTLTR
jgi:GNAT superfamily N-acetyltransferase